MNRAKALVASAVITAILSLITGCVSTEQREGHEVKFIVLGNTSPASPFTGYAEKLDQVFKTINQENPILVIHTGNIIQGGDDYMGITKKDIRRQYNKFLWQKKALHPILHILAGEKDFYNGVLDMFQSYTKEKFYYSFNYGNTHFILLHILNRNHAISPEQLKWLEGDLEKHKTYAAIFIFTHYPLISTPQSGFKHQDSEALHGIFVQYPVKGVISGNTKNFYEYDRDGIKYVAAGCYGFNFEDWHWSNNQYYTFLYDGSKLTVKGVKINFPGNSYRPKILKEEPEKK